MDWFQLFFSGAWHPWLPLALYLILLATAAWDARTGIVPNLPLAVGAALALAGQCWQFGWHGLWQAALSGAGLWAAIWGLNELWYRRTGRDAVGMGDAKWSALAAIGFGVAPAIMAWFIGAWVAIVWIGVSYAAKRPIRKVYFAPFLLCGLSIAVVLVRRILVLPYPFTFLF